MGMCGDRARVFVLNDTGGSCCTCSCVTPECGPPQFCDILCNSSGIPFFSPEQCMLSGQTCVCEPFCSLQNNATEGIHTNCSASCAFNSTNCNSTCSESYGDCLEPSFWQCTDLNSTFDYCPNGESCCECQCRPITLSPVVAPSPGGTQLPILSPSTVPVPIPGALPPIVVSPSPTQPAIVPSVVPSPSSVANCTDICPSVCNASGIPFLNPGQCSLSNNTCTCESNCALINNPSNGFFSTVPPIVHLMV